LTEGSNRAFGGNDQSAARWYAKSPAWWEDHWQGAVDQTVEFLGGDGLSMSDAVVLDLGCGDGIFALGLARRTGALRVVAMDLVPVDLEFLATIAGEHGVDTAVGPLPEFVTTSADSIPLPDSSVDVVVTWSVFEHVADPRALLREVNRVLRPTGVLMIQIWPLYYSEHGSHLWPFFEEPFAQLRQNPDAIERFLQERLEPGLAAAMTDLFRSCNQITVDDLQVALRAESFYVSKVELLHNSFHLPPELQDMPISRLGIDGVKLLAVRAQ